MIDPKFTRTAIQLFEKMARPTNFFSTMFTSRPPTNQFKISVDIVREEENIAIDIVPGSGAAEFRKNEPFTNKEYIPPEYDEMYIMTADQLNQRLAGQNAFTLSDRQAATAMFVAKTMRKTENRILRAIELQCIDALINGQVTLVNSETVTFNQKATHQIAAASAWSNAAANVLKDVEDAGDVNREDGLNESNLLIMGATSIREFLATDQMKDQQNFRRTDLIDITPPRGSVESGAKFHGMVSVGPYTYQLWSYPQFYKDENDVKRRYMPLEKVIVMNSDAQFDKYFGAINRFADGNVEGAQVAGFDSIIATSEPVEFAPYVFLGNRGKSLEVGTRSRPLVVPTDIDSFSVITT